MKTDSANREFEALIARKYAGLQARFPAPAIKPTEPYPRIPSEFPFANTLHKPADVHRILWLVPWMVTGGADKVNLDWITALMHNGYQATVCATLVSHHDWMHEFAKLTPDVFVLPNFLRTVDYPRFLHYLIRSRQIDTVMITGSTFGYLVLPYLRAHLPDVAFVDLCHVEEPHWLNGGHPRFGVGYQEMLDLNFVTTAHLREWMIERGASPELIEVCHSGIDVARLDSTVEARTRARESLGLAPDIPVIVFAGRICEQKRPLFLVDILHALAARGLVFQALVIGDGELRPAMEDKLRQLQPVPPVRMMGTVGHDGWLQALAASDIFLLPSQYEGISVALLEAMGMGLVPITAAVGGQDAVVTPECGYLIPHGANELEDYASALARLLADPSLRAAIGGAARRRILDEFSLGATTTVLLEGLERARRLARTEPRVTIGPGFATELATLAAEYTRLSVAADMLWAHWVKTRAGLAPVAIAEPPPQPESPPPQHASPSGLERLGALLSETRPMLLLRRSPRLRALGRWLMSLLEKRQRARAMD